MDAQFKKGILDICVLSILEKKEIYGYGLEMGDGQFDGCQRKYALSIAAAFREG